MWDADKFMSVQMQPGHFSFFIPLFLTDVSFLVELYISNVTLYIYKTFSVIYLLNFFVLKKQQQIFQRFTRLSVL